MIGMKHFCLFVCCFVASTSWAAPKKPATKKKPRVQRISGEGTADSVEGWIIRRTKDGKIIKIPKKQKFKFSGSEVSGEANRPNETLLGARTTPRAATLIPERRSYRKEILGTVGYKERNAK